MDATSREKKMDHRSIASRALLAAAVLAVGSAPAAAQRMGGGVTGQVSFHIDSVKRTAPGGIASRTLEISTAVNLESPVEDEGSGFDYRLDLRRSQAVQGVRPERTSIYDAYVGGHFGENVQLRVRAGHMWLQDLGTIGTLAGGLLEVGHAPSTEGIRLRSGVFFGREPNTHAIGYVSDVRKVGAYAAVESGFLRRHVVGYTRITQSGLTERSVVSATNFVPAGRNFFAYQAAEFEISGPAQGTGPSGLSYFVANVRYSATERVELTGNYNRGRSIDARTLTADLLNGRALTPQAVEGLRYESRGARLTVEVIRGTRLYGSYSQDRTNRDDALTARIMVGGHASNVLRSGVDVSASDSRIDRPMGAYHSRYFSIGRSVGRSVYVSGDYSTSLSVIQFLRSDGVVIETRPWTRRFSVSGNATLRRHLSLLLTADYTKDDAQTDLRIFSGLSYRFR
jgi:hypothetical protein